MRSAPLQFIEFQWDKYHGPKFLVNFGQTPAVIQNDETGFQNHLTQEWLPLNEVTSGLAGSNRIAIGRFHRQWFRYTWLDSLLPSGGPHKAVDRCISYLSLIDGWFAGDPASVAIVDRMNFRPASTRD